MQMPKVKIMKNGPTLNPEIEALRQQVLALTELVKSASLTPEKAAEIVAAEIAKAKPTAPFQFPVSGGVPDFGQPALTGEAAVVNDYLFIGKSILGRDFNPISFVQKMAKYNVVDVVSIQKYQQVKKTVNTMSSDDALGGDWIPTEFSSDLVTAIKMQLKVAALHPRITMPSNPFTFPVAGADAVAYIASQAKTDAATKLRASTPGTGDGITFSAVKLATRILASEELTEDSIIPILPYMRDQIVNALAVAEETATINGDTTATHMDSDVTEADDARKTFNGYRDLAVAGAKVDLGSAWNVEGVRSVRQKMGKYGVDPSKLAYVTSINGYFKLLDIKDAAGNSPIMTLEKYGPNATILTGELAKFDNIPIIVSEHCRQDLNATGVFDNITKTKTILATVYKPALVYGDRRQVRVRTKEDWETEQIIVMGSQRIDMKALVIATTEPIIGIGYNI